MYHHVDKFSAAVSVLVNHCHIKERLTEAYGQHLQDIDENDLPIPMKQRFADLRHMMTGVEPLNGEGSIRASVRKMSVHQADECATLILSLFSDVIRYSDYLQETLPLDIADEPAVPPFLVKSI